MAQGGSPAQGAGDAVSGERQCCRLHLAPLCSCGARGPISGVSAPCLLVSCCHPPGAAPGSGEH